MKKLLLLLLLSVGFISNAETTSYHKIGSTLYGDDGSECEVFGNELICESNPSYGYTSVPMELGYSSGEAMGAVINEIANAIAEGIANENTSKKKKNFNLPANSYTTSTGVWMCNNGYYEKDGFCKRIPSNAFSYANGFKCESGYKKIRNTYCLKVSTQATYTEKEVSNSQTASSSLEAKVKTTKKQSLSDLLGIIFIGLPLIGLVFWWLFKDIILI
ncbi:hypothetical protein OAI02_06045, partial [Candidatus Pseudothioglobus singularis]|nr:hypothetical protein [Candidatus Pseudothioglobus singularis]